MMRKENVSSWFNNYCQALCKHTPYTHTSRTQLCWIAAECLISHHCPSRVQHLQTTHDGVTVDFIVSGAGHEVSTSTAHLHSVPSGSLKFNWADSHAPGGFVYAETTTAHTTFYFIDSNGKSLYNTTLSPRVPPADIIG